MLSEVFLGCLIKSPFNVTHVALWMLFQGYSTITPSVQTINQCPVLSHNHVNKRYEADRDSKETERHTDLKFMSVHIQKSFEPQQRLSQSRLADHSDVKVEQPQPDFRVVGSRC